MQIAHDCRLPEFSGYETAPDGAAFTRLVIPAALAYALLMAGCAHMHEPCRCICEVPAAAHIHDVQRKSFERYAGDPGTVVPKAN